MSQLTLSPKSQRHCDSVVVRMGRGWAIFDGFVLLFCSVLLVHGSLELFGLEGKASRVTGGLFVLLAATLAIAAGLRIRQRIRSRRRTPGNSSA